MLFEDHDRLAEAKESAKAAELDSTKGVFWCDMAQALNWLGRNDEADTAFRHALSLDVNQPYTLLKYALFLKGLGNSTKRPNTHRVLDRNPSEQRATRALEEISTRLK